VHSHTMNANDFPADQLTPDPSRVMGASTGGNLYAAAANLVPMAFQALPPAGGGLPHNNMQPYLTLNFCIALQGIFPQRP